MNGYFIKDYETEEIEFSTVSQDDNVCVLVQTPNLIPKSLLLFKVFSPTLWMLIVIAFTIAIMLYSFLLFMVKERNKQISLIVEQTKEEPLSFKSSNSCYNVTSTIVSQCCRIIAILLNAPVSHSFSSSSYERLFITLCLLWGLNVMGSFQGSLVDVYTTPSSYRSINTIEELDKSGLNIIVRYPNLITDIFGSAEPGTVLGNLKKKTLFRPDDSDLKINQQIALKGNIAGFVRLNDKIRTSVNIPYRYDGEDLLYIIPDCPRTYTIGNLFPRRSVFLKTVNKYLGLFGSNGLMSKWIKDTIYVFKFEKDQRNRRNLKDKNTILTLGHLQLAFFILTFGLLISFVLFITEIYWEKSLRKAPIKVWIN